MSPTVCQFSFSPKMHMRIATRNQSETYVGTYWHALCPYLVLLRERQLLKIKTRGVCTPAAPQATLLVEIGPTSEHVMEIRMTPCWAIGKIHAAPRISTTALPKTFFWVCFSGGSKLVQAFSMVIWQCHNNKMTTLRAIYGCHMNKSFAYCAIECRILFSCYKIFYQFRFTTFVTK